MSTIDPYADVPVEDALPARCTAVTAAEAFLVMLKSRGVDVIYIGAGSDTAPIIEAYARQQESGLDFPRPVVAAHENLAVGMAHGYYMVSRRPQAVMLHVSVGAANAVCAVINAARAQVPILLTAGRTPLFESGRLGARDNTIHWAQEMFDQGGMLRELVKWDYELRDVHNMAQLIDRGLGIAMTAPRGPVYLTLPREVLVHPAREFAAPAPEAVPSEPHPDPAQVRRLAQALKEARLPVIVCTASGADLETVGMLVSLADRFGIAVAESKPRYVNFPSSHPQHAGFNMPLVLERADALLFLESDVPWLPGQTQPSGTAFVAHAACDPLFNRYPVRSFRSDLTLTSSARGLIAALHTALDELGAAEQAADRRKQAIELAQVAHAAIEAQAVRDEAAAGPISKTFLSRCLDQVCGEDTIVVNEYSALREHLRLDRPGSFFLNSNAAGLGWGLPAALGARQAAPDKVILAVMGDGTYLFANPAACHHAAAMHRLPVVTVVFNNGGWDAVHKAALTVYPDSHTARYAQRHGATPLSSLEPLPEFERYCEASGGHSERVSDRGELLPALRRAMSVVRSEGRQALVHVIGR